MKLFELKWEKSVDGHWETMIPWNNHYLHIDKVWITIERRPSYCDRGNWIVKTGAPLDHQEGFPRYYFELETAKREIQLWVNKRKETK